MLLLRDSPDHDLLDLAGVHLQGGGQMVSQEPGDGDHGQGEQLPSAASLLD
jgi:hypothetical protein